MNVADFDFHLPEALIAQEPSDERGGSRLLVLHRATGIVEHTSFSSLASWMRQGDLLVVNNTRVFSARLLGERVPSGGAVECLLLSQVADPAVSGLPASTIPSHCWEALVHPGQKLKPGARVRFERNGVVLHGELLARHFHGRRTIRLWTDAGADVEEAIDRIGHMPLPPYIKRHDRETDRDRYQTVYAREKGSVAAPTAGLHFTQSILEELAALGVERTEVTLHVGYGTFKPVRVDRVEDHVVDPERFTVSIEAAAALTRARHEGRRIIAVGTTTVRALESLQVGGRGEVVPGHGETQVFISPGHRFRLVDGMITNFHLPKSSLLMLVSALAGRDRVLAAYREAVAGGYRFYSYGDAMLIT
ncbi:MAG: tRNA preQ1(34) S-adenosylmethionine ribosyltransferase-isomerase QueA [Vicinamibacterales bacterium]